MTEPTSTVTEFARPILLPNRQAQPCFSPPFQTVFLFGQDRTHLSPHTNLYQPSPNPFGPKPSPTCDLLDLVWVLHDAATFLACVPRERRLYIERALTSCAPFSPRALRLLAPPALGHRSPCSRRPLLAGLHPPECHPCSSSSSAPLQPASPCTLLGTAQAAASPSAARASTLRPVPPGSLQLRPLLLGPCSPASPPACTATSRPTSNGAVPDELLKQSHRRNFQLRFLSPR